MAVQSCRVDEVVCSGVTISTAAVVLDVGRAVQITDSAGCQGSADTAVSLATGLTNLK